MTHNFDQSKVHECHYVVLDFETVTPKGRPPEPIELAAVRISPGYAVDKAFAFDMLIKPPVGAPITAFDTAQTGIRWEDVKDAPAAVDALRRFDRTLEASPGVLVAQNAKYEASILRRFSEACPVAVGLPIIDTVAIARHLLPELQNHRLDTLASRFGLAIPAHRHRALPDVELTVHVFKCLMRVAAEQGKLPQVRDLRRVAEVLREPAQTEPAQGSLF